MACGAQRLKRAAVRALAILVLAAAGAAELSAATATSRQTGNWGTASTWWTARTLTVNGNITVGSTGNVNVANFTVTHVLVVSGNIDNNGVFGLRFDGDSLHTTPFNGAGTQSISGGGATTEFNNAAANANDLRNKIVVKRTHVR